MNDERDEWTPPAQKEWHYGLSCYRWDDAYGVAAYLGEGGSIELGDENSGSLVLTRPMAAWLAERLAEWAKGGEL